MANKEPCFLGVVAGGSTFDLRKPVLSIGMIKGNAEFDLVFKPTELLTSKRFLEETGLDTAFLQQNGVSVDELEGSFIEWTDENDVRRGDCFVVSGNYIFDQLVLYDNLWKAINWVGFPFNELVNLVEVYNERVENANGFKQAHRLKDVVRELHTPPIKKPVTGIKTARQVQDIFLNLKSGVTYEEI